MDVSESQQFFLLGGMKCGTTSLYRWLDQHPDVFLSVPKEPVFFEAEYEKGLDFYRRRYYERWSGEAVAGEARTHNLFLPFVAGRIRESFPETRLVAVLRNPIERLHSHWWHRYTLGLERLPLEQALDENRKQNEAGPLFEGPEGPRRWAEGRYNDFDSKTRWRLYLDLGCYAEQLERYLRLFPAARLKVLLFEDLARDPEGTTRQVWEFLGLDPNRPLSDLAAENVARERVASRALGRLRRMRHPERVRRLFPKPVRRLLRPLTRGRAAEPPSMTPDTEARLLEYYAPHNRALEPILERPLDAWFEPRGS